MFNLLCHAVPDSYQDDPVPKPQESICQDPGRQ